MSRFPKPKDAQDAVYFEGDPLARGEAEQLLEAVKSRQQSVPADTGVPAPAPKEAKHRKARVWDADEKIRRDKQALEARLRSQKAKRTAPVAGRPQQVEAATPAARPTPPKNPAKAPGGFSLGSCVTGGCLTVALLIGAVLGLAWWNNRPDDYAGYSYGADSRKTWTGAFYPDGSDLTSFLPCAGFASSQSACLEQCDQAAASYCERNACDDVDMECWAE